MRDFNCPNCGQRLAFENSTCLNCGSALGFSLEQTALLVITEDDASEHAGFVNAAEYQLCANLQVAECNWLVPVNYPRLLCPSCVLTTERPNDVDTSGLAEFAAAEAAKRRLIVELHELKLPANGPDGAPLSYKFHHKNSGRQVQDTQTLAEAAVHDGDILRLQPEITAG